MKLIGFERAYGTEWCDKGRQEHGDYMVVAKVYQNGFIEWKIDKTLCDEVSLTTIFKCSAHYLNEFNNMKAKLKEAEEKIKLVSKKTVEYFNLSHFISSLRDDIELLDKYKTTSVIRECCVNAAPFPVIRTGNYERMLMFYNMD